GDRSKAKISYVLLKNKNTGLPELFCNHHKGVVVRGYYQRGENGKLQMKVETIVRATLPQELLRKLK
ncbi:MAG: hypothetical protein KGZ25_09130, partial [Planctomycetes bacterium]|nr:hypothetical protein [Planctomycetota bacterium]